MRFRRGEDRDKGVWFDILVLDILELLSLEMYGWEEEEIKVSGDMGKEIDNIIYLGNNDRKWIRVIRV